MMARRPFHSAAAALQKIYPRIGYIKPVGQRFVEIEEQKIDEDTVLMDAVFRLNCPLVDMSPSPLSPTSRASILQSSNHEGAGAKNRESVRPRCVGKGFRSL